MFDRPRAADWDNPRSGGGRSLDGPTDWPRRNEVKAACRVEATCLVKVKRRREHRRKLTLPNFPRKIAAWRKRLLLKTVGLTCRSTKTTSSASANCTPATTSRSCSTRFSGRIIFKTEITWLKQP